MKCNSETKNQINPVNDTNKIEQLAEIKLPRNLIKKKIEDKFKQNSRKLGKKKLKLL